MKNTKKIGLLPNLFMEISLICIIIAFLTINTDKENTKPRLLGLSPPQEYQIRCKWTDGNGNVINYVSPLLTENAVNVENTSTFIDSTTKQILINNKVDKVQSLSDTLSCATIPI